MNEELQWTVIAVIIGVWLWRRRKPRARRRTGPKFARGLAPQLHAKPGAMIKPFAKRDKRAPKVNDEIKAVRLELKQDLHDE